jgi:hypothetical protein
MQEYKRLTGADIVNSSEAGLTGVEKSVTLDQGILKGGSLAVPLTSCLTGLD